MKIKLLFLLSFIILSCSNNSDQLETQDLSIESFPQKWSLYKMTGSLLYSETNGNDMPYQEYYIFNSDNTFSKTRILDKNEVSISGLYEIEMNNDGVAFLLNYPEESDLVGNCSSKKEEYLYLDDQGTTLLSSWWACDGPGLFYKQVPID